MYSSEWTHNYIKWKIQVVTQTKENHDADSYTKHEKVTRLTDGFPAVGILHSIRSQLSISGEIVLI
jgi:hypothetical protein